MAVTTVASELTDRSAKKTKSRAVPGSKNPKPKSTRRKTSEMVNNAMKDLEERGGSLLQAIKKFISAQYKVVVEKIAPFIRKYLKSAVASRALIQTKGKGNHSGSSGAAASTAGRPKKTIAASPNKKASASPSKVGRPAAKDKKAAAAKRKPESKAKSTAAAAKLMAKKNAKPSTKIPKAPKLKRDTTPKAKITAKKSAAKN